MFGDSRAVNSQPRRKHKHHKHRLAPKRLWALRYEQLEERILTLVEPDLSIPTTLVDTRRSRQRADQRESAHGQPRRLA